jgi:nitrate reductase beta subunit
MLQNRQLSDSLAGPANKTSRVNLLNWDGKGSPQGLFPPKPDSAGPVQDATTPDTSDDGATGPGGTGGLTGGADYQ